MPIILTLASMYSILRSRAVNFSFSVASLERQDISGKRRLTFRINAIPDTNTHTAPKLKRRNDISCRAQIRRTSGQNKAVGG